MLRKLVQTGVPSIQWPMFQRISGRNSSTLFFPRRFILLLLIVLVALLLRLWALDRVPPPLWQDEVSHGYNAHSLLHTGRDEYGVAWPLSIRGYETYHVPLYIYMTVPSVAIFGLTPVGVRLPSALAGAFSVAVMYAVTVQLLRSWRLGLCAGRVPCRIAVAPPIQPRSLGWELSLATCAGHGRSAAGRISQATGARRLSLLRGKPGLFVWNLFLYCRGGLLTVPPHRVAPPLLGPGNTGATPLACCRWDHRHDRPHPLRVASRRR